MKNRAKFVLITFMSIIAISFFTVKGSTSQFEEDIKQLMPEYMRANAIIKVDDYDFVTITSSIPFEKSAAIMELGNVLSAKYLKSISILQDAISNDSIIRFEITGTLGKSSTFVNDTGEKIVKEYDKDGQLSTEWIFRDGGLEWEKRYYKSGKLELEIPHKNNKIEGTYKKYYENGRLKAIGLFKEGVLEGIEKKYYESGQLEKEVPYLNGEREGIMKEYYENGQLKQEVSYLNSEIEGTWKEYYENGKLSLEAVYKNGNREGITKHYDKNGKLDMEEMYKDGKCIERNYPKGYLIFALLSLCLILLWKIISSSVGIFIFVTTIILLVFRNIYLIRKRKLQNRKDNA